MPSSLAFQSQILLKSPLRTPLGTIELAGILQNAEGISPSRMRTLEGFAFVLMVSGKGYYQDALGAQEVLGPGDVVVVFPELAHAYGPVSGESWTQLYFVVNGPQFDLWRSHGLLEETHPVLRLGSAEYWRQRLGDVVKGESPSAAGGPLRAMGRFVQVITEMLAADGEGRTRAGRDAWLEKSLHLLGDHSGGGWPLPQEVATQIGLNYENFRKRFAKAMGESPGRYQKRRRLEWASAAIYQGEQSLKQIADALDFCDVFHFSKAFKQEMGMSPSDYRRRVRGQ